MSSAAPRDPRAEREAIEWLERLDNPSVPNSEVEAFRVWLNASEANRLAFSRLKATWEDIGPAAAQIYAEADSASNDLERSAARIRRANLRTRFALIGSAIAASLALLFVPTPNWTPSADAAASYETAALELRAVDLEDGSRVELSPLARATISYSASERRVELHEGVAYFDIVHDISRPFVVATPFGVVRANAAAFVVRIGERNADLVMLRGETANAGPNQPATLWARLTRDIQSVQAAPNTEVRLSSDEPRVEALDERSLDQRVAWRERRIALEDVPLRDVADEVTRFSGVTFDIPDRRLAQERVSLFLEGRDVEGFLGLLETNLGVSVERRSSDYIILRSADR